MVYRHGRLAGTFILIALGVSVIVTADTLPSRAPASAIAPADSLYARLGGTPVVSAFVADTIDRVVANPEMNRSFDKANLQLTRDLLTQRICTLTGGGCTYDGDKKRDVHSSHELSRAEFSGLVEAMRESMRARGVPLAARNELLEILAPMPRDVVKL